MTDQTQQNLDALSQRAAELRNEMQSLSNLADRFGEKLVTSFASAAIHGKSLGDVMRSLVLSLSQTALTSALKPLGNLVGNLFSGLFANANGNAFSNGRVLPFADGGVVNSPVLFPMQGGTGLMGEAGPEAIMPLSRGRDGKLGVRGGGSATQITINISTPDVQSFAQSQSQIAALMNQAIARGARNL
jgi:lambda family phage tail tape measure protein